MKQPKSVCTMKPGCPGGRRIIGNYYEHKSTACPEYGKPRRRPDGLNGLRELLP